MIPYPEAAVRLTRFVFAVLLCLLFLPTPRTFAAASAPSQRDWMINLVDGLGLSFGLPDEPHDADYQRILSGNRHLRIEAEDHHLPTDMVSTNTFLTFGAYSGKGWVNGIAIPTKANLRFLLPLSGRYRATAKVRSSGHVFHFGDAQATVSAGENRFHEVDLGTFDLTAGEQTVQIDLPPNTSIDYLELDAPSLASIAPPGGWQPDAPLTFEDLAVCAAQVLALEKLLPPATARYLFEAETALASGILETTDIRHLGRPSGGKWLRAGVAQTPLVLRFTPSTAGVFDLYLRGESEQPVTGKIDGQIPVRIAFPPYLEDVYVTTLALSKTEHTLTLSLPMMAGIDALQLHERRSDGADYRRLAGLGSGTVPTQGDIDRVLALLALLHPNP